MQNSILIPVVPLSSPVMSGQIISLIKDPASPLEQIFISLSSGEKWKKPTEEVHSTVIRK